MRRRRRSCRPAVRRRWPDAPGSNPRRSPDAWRGGDALDRRHVGRLAVQVHRQDGARPRRDRALDRVGIDRQRARRRCRRRPAARPAIMHRQRRVGGGQRRRDDFVARADAERAEDQRERVGAGADADGVRRAARRARTRPRTLRLRGRGRTSRWRRRARSRRARAAASSRGASDMNGMRGPLTRAPRSPGRST